MDSNSNHIPLVVLGDYQSARRDVIHAVQVSPNADGSRFAVEVHTSVSDRPEYVSVADSVSEARSVAASLVADIGNPMFVAVTENLWVAADSVVHVGGQGTRILKVTSASRFGRVVVSERVDSDVTAFIRDLTRVCNGC